MRFREFCKEGIGPANTINTTLSPQIGQTISGQAGALNANTSQIASTVTAASDAPPANTNQVTPNQLQQGSTIKLPFGVNKNQEDFTIGQVNPNKKTVSIINKKAKPGQPIEQTFNSDEINNILNLQGK